MNVASRILDGRAPHGPSAAALKQLSCGVAYLSRTSRGYGVAERRPIRRACDLRIGG